ncbi:MAG: CpsD/CapB family tyrosine-protein kinase [Thermodesulfobacteriota bacterium]
MGKIFQALEKQGGALPAHDPETPESGSDLPPQSPPQPEPLPPGPVASANRANHPAGHPAASRPSFDQSRWDPRLRLSTAANSTITESFRKVRNTILHPPSGIIPRSILVTSAMPEEGKSFICANLGVSLAQSLEQHCLLVDCDLRRPTLAGLFGVAGDRGLSTYLRGEETLEAVIRKTGLAKLSVIPSGPSTPNPAELLDTTGMQHLMAELVDRYPDRYILFDSPPVQAAAETAVLAKHADAVVLVVRWGKSGREQVQKVAAAIGKEKIIGVVFNAFEVSTLDSALYKKGYYGYYGSGYGY